MDCERGDTQAATIRNQKDANTQRDESHTSVPTFPSDFHK